jgi:SPOR domain
VRAAFFLLLFANLAFLAWAQWIDAPQPAPTNEAYAKLPRLKLVNELPPPPEESRPSSSNARKTALEVAPPPAAASCISVGPFDDQDSATRGATKLRDRGFTPRQRTAQAEVSKGFWVFIGGLKTDGDVAQVLSTLQQSHIEDAHVMPDTGDLHQVSVGLFTDRDRADHRAQSVQKLGLQPEVTERKLPTTVFWMDVDVPPGTASPTAQDVTSPATDDSNVSVTSCPGSAAPPVPAPDPDSTTPFRTKVAGASKVP